MVNFITQLAENPNLPLYVLGALGLLTVGFVVILIATIRHGGKRPAANSAPGNPEQKANTIVFDQMKGKLFEFFDWGENNPGRLWRYGDQQYYLAKRRKGSAALEIVAPAQTISDEVLPEVLYRAMHDDLSPVLFKFPTSLWEKLGTAGMLGLVAIMALLLICLRG